MRFWPLLLALFSMSCTTITLKSYQYPVPFHEIVDAEEMPSAGSSRVVVLRESSLNQIMKGSMGDARIEIWQVHQGASKMIGLLNPGAYLSWNQSAGVVQLAGLHRQSKGNALAQSIINAGGDRWRNFEIAEGETLYLKLKIDSWADIIDFEEVPEDQMKVKLKKAKMAVFQDPSSVAQPDDDSE